MASTVAEILPAAAVTEAAGPDDPALEWWYANLLIEAPGTPIDGMALIVGFARFEEGSDELRAVIISPDTGLFVNFGTGPLPLGSIRTRQDRVDVRYGPSYFRGGYPEYELHVEGEATTGVNMSATLRYAADVEPELTGYMDQQIKHFVVYRNRISGTIGIGENIYEVTGLGYVEHFYGSLGWVEPLLGAVNPPSLIDGWNWYWCPAAGAADLTVQVGTFAAEERWQPFVSISADGKTYELFVNGTWDVLETRRTGGITYPHRARVTDRSETGEIDLTITRNEGAFRYERESGAGLKLVFVSGLAAIEGSVTLNGTTYDISDRLFGSVFLLHQSKAIQVVRNLPAALRVPLGRTLKLARDLAGRV